MLFNLYLTAEAGDYYSITKRLHAALAAECGVEIHRESDDSAPDMAFAICADRDVTGLIKSVASTIDSAFEIHASKYN